MTTPTSRAGKPIVIAPYDPLWAATFADERAMILRACGPDAFVRIEHVGSTAVPGLAAKPIVDIMPGVRSLAAFTPCIAALERIGYQYVPEFERDGPSGPGMPFRRYFRKDVDGVRAFHLHVVEHGSDFWRDHLLFRNYLRFNADDLQAYADLKRRLADEYNRTMIGTDINLGYTEHKSELINAIMAKARERAARSTPISHASYDPAWPQRFERERAKVAGAMGGHAIAIEHVGSTSVAGLHAKPTIDVAIGVRSMEESRAATPALLAAGYAKGRDNFPDWRYFDIEARPSGEMNVHLHLVPFGGRRWNRYLLFRDYLRAHPDVAADYAALKLALAEEFGRDRLGYVEAKTDFIEEVLQRARTVHLA